MQAFPSIKFLSNVITVVFHFTNTCHHDSFLPKVSYIFDSKKIVLSK